MATVHATESPLWGNNLAEQISANDVSIPGGDNGALHKTIPAPVWYNKNRTKKIWVGGKKVPATDEDVTWRHYRHKCALLSIVMNNRKECPPFTMFFDEHTVSRFNAAEVTFCIDSEVGDQPMAEIWFRGYGTRFGPLEEYGTSRVICTFSSEEQMRQYFTVTG